jgi:hypothetical protein
MTLLLTTLEIAAVAAALVAAVLWWQSCCRTVRRFSRYEELDAADLNRLVVAINRNQLLNRRAALASAVAAFLAASSFAIAAVVPQDGGSPTVLQRDRSFPAVSLDLAMSRLCSGYALVNNAECSRASSSVGWEATDDS